MDGKGIYYHKNGNRYDGDWKNCIKEGKGIYYYNLSPWIGDRYEGDWRIGLRDGQGIYCYNNGDREIADYHNNKEIGIHVFLTRDGEVKVKNY